MTEKRTLSDNIVVQFLRTPVTVYAVIVLAAGILAIVNRPLASAAALRPSALGSIWPIASGLIQAPRPVSLIVVAILLASIGNWTWNILRPSRWLSAGLLGYIAGVAGASLWALLVDYLRVAPGRPLMNSVLVGPSLVLISVLAAATPLLPRWLRRRIRLALGLFVGILMLFGGSAQDAALTCATIAGPSLGKALWPSQITRQLPRKSVPSTDARGLLAVTVAAVSVGSVVAARSRAGFALLGGIQFGVFPRFWTEADLDRICSNGAPQRACMHAVLLNDQRGVGPILLALMPVILQLVLAWGLARGRRSAAVGTVILQVLVAILSTVGTVRSHDIIHRAQLATGDVHPAALTPGMLFPAFVAFFLALLVGLNWYLFPVRASQGTHSRALLRALGWVALMALVMVLVATLLRGQMGSDASIWDSLHDFGVRLLPAVGYAVFPLRLPGSGPTVDFVDFALPLLAWAGIIWFTYDCLRAPDRRDDALAEPVVARPVATSPSDDTALDDAAAGEAAAPGPTASQPQTERERYRDLVRRTDAGTMGWMGTWAGRHYWFSPGDRAGVAYEVHSGVALSVADPAAGDDYVRRALQFAENCENRGLTPAFYSVHEPLAQALEAQGWYTVQVAEETVLPLGTLKFTGKKFQSIRTARNKATGAGITARWYTYSEMRMRIWEQIEAISGEWVSEKSLPEMGFTLGGTAELRDEEVRILLAVDEDDRVHAASSWMPVYRDGKLVGLTLDFMRHAENGMSQAIEFLIAEAALSAQESGLEFVSLSGAPLAHALDDEDRSGIDSLLDWIGEKMEPIYGFRSLLRFKSKFKPEYQPLYLVIADPADLPKVGLAISRAYLPDLSAADVLKATRMMARRG